MKTIKLLGIRSPGSIFLIENILKNNDHDDVRFELSAGSETGIEKLPGKYGYSIETGKDGENIVVRMKKGEIKMEEIDITGETCPGPAIIVGEKLTSMSTGEKLKIKCSAKETLEDVTQAAISMGSKVAGEGSEKDRSYIIVEKCEKKSCGNMAIDKDNVVIVQSNGIGNAEKAYATFIFSKVALSMGKKVTIFTLMDGVSLFKKGNAEGVKHPDFDRLDKLMNKVRKGGAIFYACELSSKFRNIKQSDLVEGAKLSGAATYLSLLSDPNNTIVNF